MSAGDIFLGLLAVIFPPIAVWVKSGLCSCDSLINILLCMLGYIPGLIHAWYIISIYPEPQREYQVIVDEERGAGHSSRRGGSTRTTSHHYYIVRDNTRGGSGGGGYGAIASNESAPNVPTETRPQGQENGGGEGSNGITQQPPTYAEAVRGDHKIQTRD